MVENKNLRGKIAACNTVHTDAYMIAVRNGFEGTEAEWLASLKGEKGEIGELISSIRQTKVGVGSDAENELTITTNRGVEGKFIVKNGAKGDIGKQGHSITGVHQVATSTESGGRNQICVTIGTGDAQRLYYFNVYNGAKGEKGDAYALTDADKDEIASLVVSNNHGGLKDLKERVDIMSEELGILGITEGMLYIYKELADAILDFGDENSFYIETSKHIELDAAFFNSCMYIDEVGVYVYPYVGTLTLYMYEAIDVAVNGDVSYDHPQGGVVGTFYAPQDIHVTLA